MRSYEVFLVTHIILVIIGLVACWYHLVPHFGFDYGYQVWLYIGFAFWFFDRLARFVRIAYYNRLGKSEAVVEAIPGCDILQVTVYPRVAWVFGPGQHSFLYIPALGKVWENHPFSIASWSQPGEKLPGHSSAGSLSEKQHTDVATKQCCAVLSTVELEVHTNDTAGTHQIIPSRQVHSADRTAIRFLIRVHSGATATLQHRILSSPLSPRLDLSVYTEGPYAGHRATLQPLILAETVLCLAGGIGVTNALGYVQAFLDKNPKRSGEGKQSRGILGRTRRFVFAWSARESALIEHVKQGFLADAGDIECSFWHTGAPKTSPHDEQVSKYGSSDPGSLSDSVRAAPRVGRMDVGHVIRSALEVGHQATVVVCGPGSMADEATKQVVACVKDGFKVDLIEETYTW